MRPPVEAGENSPLPVIVFIDWQNTYSGAREAFGFQGQGPIAGNVDPWRLARVLAAAADPTSRRRTLQEVRVYRGRPSQDKDRKTYAAHRAQTATWERVGGEMLKVRHRLLRYPVGGGRPQEKGIDVLLAIELVEAAIRHQCARAVVMSTDTDLLPAIELAVEERGESFVEVAGWVGSPTAASLLHVKGSTVLRRPLRRHAYDRLEDRTDYTRPAYKRASDRPNWEAQDAAQGRKRRR